MDQHRWIAGGIAVAVLAVVLSFGWAWRSPDFVFLHPEGGAEWIRADTATVLQWRPAARTGTQFESSLGVETLPETAILTVRATRRALVSVNGEQVLDTGEDTSKWKRRARCDVAPYLVRGENVVAASVLNQDGPPCLLAYCHAIGLRTGADWQAESQGNWRSARLAAPPPLPEMALRFGTSTHALVRAGVLLLPAFLLVAFLSMHSDWQLGRFRRGPQYPASIVRWILLAAWLVLCANNISKLPLHVGAGAMAHTDSIRAVTHSWRIPVYPGNGAPFDLPILYYFLSAPVYLLATKLLAAGAADYAIRLVPMLCGAAQIEVCYRALRRIFPERNDLQIAGTLFAAVLPLNLYLSQVAGNIPLCAALSGLSVLWLISVLARESAVPGTLSSTGIGLCLAFAVSSHWSALPLVPVAAVLLWHRNRKANLLDWRGPAKPVAAMLAVPLAVLALQYLLFRMLGETSAAGAGWCDPGYRTPGQLFWFGTALHLPLSAGMRGIWDGLYATFWLDGSLSGATDFNYAPPWHYGPMLSCAWLALIPSFVLLLGVVVALSRAKKPAASPLLLCALLPLLYAAVLFCRFCMVPAHTNTDAAPLAGLLPACAALFAAGLSLLPPQGIIRAVFLGALGSWAVASYLSFFVW